MCVHSTVKAKQTSPQVYIACKLQTAMDFAGATKFETSNSIEQQCGKFMIHIDTALFFLPVIERPENTIHITLNTLNEILYVLNLFVEN